MDPLIHSNANRDYQSVETSALAPLPVGEQAKEQILNTLDNRKFSTYHVKAILVSGVGFFTDAYDLFIINMVVPMIGYAYYNGHMSVLDQTLLKGSAVIGTFIGQILFGILGDVFGRKKVYGISLLLMIIGALSSCVSASTVRGVGVVGFVCFWRLTLGVGIGGDYPLSAVITSEYASKHSRGRMIAAVFSFQGFGNLFAAIVSLVVLLCFKGAIRADPLNVDYVWRICLGLGIVPAVITVYFRAQLPETPRFVMDVERNVAQASIDVRAVTGSAGGAAVHEDQQQQQQQNNEPQQGGPPKPSWSDFRAHFGKWENFKVIFGTASCWFLLDIAFYGLNLNQSIILDKIGWGAKDTSDVYDHLFALAVGNAIVNILGNVPGYWFTVAFVDKMGRRKIQFMGFAILTIVFVILASGYQQIRDNSVWLFIALYCIAQFFFNFGPNATTFIVPGEVFPTRYRSTGHGISAASGKLGAIIASYGFGPIADMKNGVRNLIAALAVVMLLGFLCTILIPETKGASLEELNGEKPIDSRRRRDDA
eukprot:TRINITY_DN829_c0_g1_i3.p1 TRINITY_DN829_c0_g1~~TRINITY_DN829_c0_g1_i3.p1  ORF type:complete len:537 (+),score=93.49 TRINITY_DN829_c0_g1_i3:188-1798(+)